MFHPATKLSSSGDYAQAAPVCLNRAHKGSRRSDSRAASRAFPACAARVIDNAVRGNSSPMTEYQTPHPAFNPTAALASPLIRWLRGRDQRAQVSMRALAASELNGTPGTSWSEHSTVGDATVELVGKLKRCRTWVVVTHSGMEMCRVTVSCRLNSSSAESCGMGRSEKKASGSGCLGVIGQIQDIGVRSAPMLTITGRWPAFVLRAARLAGARLGKVGIASSGAEAPNGIHAGSRNR